MLFSHDFERRTLFSKHSIAWLSRDTDFRELFRRRFRGISSLRRIFEGAQDVIQVVRKEGPLAGRPVAAEPREFAGLPMGDGLDVFELVGDRNLHGWPILMGCGDLD